MFRRPALLVTAITSTTTTAAADEPVRHVVEARYDAEAGGFTDGASAAAIASIGGDLDYRASLVDDRGRPTYDIEAGAGLSIGRMQGTVSATRAATRARLHIGPSVIPASENRATLAWFPFSFELDHDGELGALPRLSARPDANRAVFDRGRAALATRLFRIELGETDDDSDSPKEPVSSALDLITFFADVDATAQDGNRVETGFGGALMSVVNHYTRGERLDILALEDRTSRLPDGASTSVASLWVMRMSITNPATGSDYTLGWGVAIGELYSELATPTEDDPDPDLDIGGVGWWWERGWGGLGLQYLREPYVTMAGEPALDDRGFVEVWRAGKLALSARGFVARTRRSVDGVWLSDWSTGVELGARRRVAGMTIDLDIEAGQTHYAELDGGRPELGLAARGQLSVRRSGRRSWAR